MALFENVIVIDGLCIRDEIRSASKFFETLTDARKRWRRKWLFLKRDVHEVVFDGGSMPGNHRDKIVEAFAQEAIKTGKQYQSFVKPLAFDLERSKWVFAFNNKSDAMMFKLAYGGAA